MSGFMSGRAKFGQKLGKMIMKIIIQIKAATRILRERFFRMIFGCAGSIS